ncbi:hypothetical protein [Flavobacterium macacae]|uniref:Uncharacterized protein n=1 Tax=Flavobacterium macacae TaxID=2488993 RepID=A0A3P3W4Q2_9FLAO|nr:hypothetical protein [Flavobacterium macacae]RRJ87783.1 hypothetical protein EG849_15070 [Flavobacterium macacae]
MESTFTEKDKIQLEKVFILESNGSKCIFSGIEELFEYIKIEFEENYEEKTEFKVFTSEMSKEELDNMSEFDGF